MRLISHAVSFTVICLALTQTAVAQGGRQGGGGSLAALVFPSPPPVTVKDGFTYAVLGDISQVHPVTQNPFLRRPNGKMENSRKFESMRLI